MPYPKSLVCGHHFSIDGKSRRPKTDSWRCGGPFDTRCTARTGMLVHGILARPWLPLRSKQIARATGKPFVDGPTPTPVDTEHRTEVLRGPLPASSHWN